MNKDQALRNVSRLVGKGNAVPRSYSKRSNGKIRYWLKVWKKECDKETATK